MTQPVQPSRVPTGSVRPSGVSEPVSQAPAPGEEAVPPQAAPPTPAPPSRAPASAAPTKPASTRRSRKAQRRHARVVIRKVAPWSVFKVSLIFYLCLMLALIGAGMILYGVLGAIGALDSTTRLIRDLFADPEFEINGQWLFSRGVTIGLLMVVVCSIINVFIAFLYNLISDLVGGIEVTLAERR
jgi:hypothetical protein